LTSASVGSSAVFCAAARNMTNAAAAVAMNEARILTALL
jgi:hypothetical protein